MSTTVNMHEAKSTLSRLVQAIELGSELEIIIARNGRPVARLLPMEAARSTQHRIGVAKGLFKVPDHIDQHNDQVQRLFLGTTA
jgi:antitoxin (DNA-binding transcriptional repressor) of toxin-antitoxin stability system